MLTCLLCISVQLRGYAYSFSSVSSKLATAPPITYPYDCREIVFENAKTLQHADSTAAKIKARRELLETIHQLQVQAYEPNDYLEQTQINYSQLSCLRWLIRFHIFDHVPNTGTISFESIATAARVPLSKLRSICRMSVTNGLLAEPSPGQLAHSRLSVKLWASKACKDWATFLSEYSCPTALSMADATTRWGDTDAKNETAYNVFTATDLPFFQHVAQSSRMTEQFAGYMRSQNESEAGAMRHLVEGFDWGALGKARVVDVGGSSGHVSIFLASQFPDLEFLVTDLPGTIDVAKVDFEKREIESSVASRIAFTSNDFFTSDSLPDGDVYLLRKILHDWPFAEARVILQNLSKAMKTGSRLVVMDTILPKPGSTSARQESLLRVRDLTMMQSFNSRERELDDWTQLYESTAPKLRLVRHKLPAGSSMAVMEVVKAERGPES